MSAARVIDLQVEASPLDGHEAIGLAAELPPRDVIRLVRESRFRHVVQSKGLCCEREIETSRLMLQSPEFFFDAPMHVIFGADSGQSKNSRRKLELSFGVTQSKREFLSEVGDFVASVRGTRSIWDQALMVADELFTNSAKNAWPKGRALFEGDPERQGKIEFNAWADAERLVFTCRDSFGELDVNTVVSRIETCFDKGMADSIKHGTTGAGLGSFMIFDACMSYYAGASPGVCTVVGVAFPLGLGAKVRETLPKNVHLVG